MDILPALGTHEPVSDLQRELFFGKEIPKERFIEHNWRTSVVKSVRFPRSL